jgi:hypothetical protein
MGAYGPAAQSAGPSMPIRWPHRALARWHASMGHYNSPKSCWATNPNYAKVNPQIAERLKQIETQDRHYVAHEYFNRDWLPMSFSQMAGWLSPAKLDFACSATYLDHLPAVHLTTEQRAMLDELTDQVFRQSVRDFMVNQQFRRDYWVKGQRTLNALEYAEQLRALRVVMTAGASPSR